ncbi:focadhesin isoform X2 [Bacillus rossius redtenbacheri]|uniref:focadhesin isoform X2 n=2 Tax=Bacillus rossius redtenbacheri TaxID=93214 RepID=UPI002FDE5BF6
METKIRMAESCFKLVFSKMNHCGLVPSIGSLLILELRAQHASNNNYRCPFTLRSPQHPFISLLKQESSTWPDIFSQMSFVFNHKDELVANNCVELLKPVLLYLLCNPSPNTSFTSGCGKQLWSLLLKFFDKPHVREFVVELLCWVQVEDEEGLSAVEDVARGALGRADAELAAALAPCLAALVRRAVSRGRDPRPCLDLVPDLLACAPESGSCVLVLLSEAIAKCPVIYLHSLFRTCGTIVQKKTCNAVSVKMLVSNALQWLIHPSCLTGEALQLASDLMRLVEDCVSQGGHTGRLCGNKVFSHVRNLDPAVHAAAELCRLAEAWQGSPELFPPWLARAGQAPPHFVQGLVGPLSAVFLGGLKQDDAARESYRFLLQLVARDNELASGMLTFVLYKLSGETDPSMQLELLRGLPATAVQKENVSLVLHTLETVRSKPSLKVVMVHLYLRLWRAEGRCYPYLQKLLLEPPQEEKDERSWELEVAKALAIREICRTRPELHGEELVSMLSQVLNRCGGVWGAAPSSMAVESITALCGAGIVDIATTWRALAPKLARDKRPLVCVSLCKFFGSIPSIRGSGPEFVKLVSEAVAKLWAYVSTSNSLEVIEAALKALSKFTLEDLTLKGLPECYRRDLKLPSAYAKTPVDAARKPEDVLPYIPGECWIQLLENVKEEALDVAGDTLASWLAAELSGYHGGLYQLSGRGEPSSYGHLHHRSVCRAIVDHLRRDPGSVPGSLARQCLRVVARTFVKPLPPLDWGFLQEFLRREGEVRRLAQVLAAKQAKISPSARRLMENLLTSFQPAKENEEEIKNLFAYLPDLCNGVPPNHLRPFIAKCLEFAVHNALSEQGNDSNEEKFLKELFLHIKSTLQREDIHDANKTVLILLLEGLLETFDADNKLFPTYVECVAEMPTKYLERMTSPSVWWEVTPAKLRQSIGIRGALAQRADSEVPLVWLNECIDAAAGLPGEQSNVLKCIANVISNSREHDTHCRWSLELIGQIQATITSKTDADNQQAVTFLCDVLLLAVVVMAGHDCLVQTLESVACTREVRLQLFPQALRALLATNQWAEITDQVIEWLHQMQTSDTVPSQYAAAFRKAIITLRHNKYFKKSSVWMRVIPARMPGGQQ